MRSRSREEAEEQAARKRRREAELIAEERLQRLDEEPGADGGGHIDIRV